MHKIKIWDKDNFYLLFILSLSSILIYFTNPDIARLGYLVFLIAAFKSKKNYVWLAFLFIIFDTPNYFYYGGAANDPTRVPLYSLGRNLSLGFQDLLMLVLFIKSLRKRLNRANTFQKELSWFSILFVVYVAFSFIFGIRISNLAITIRSVLPLLFLFIIPKLFTSEGDWFNFLKVLFPIVIFTFIGEIFFILKSKPLIVLLDPSMIDKVNENFIFYMKGSGPSRFFTGVGIGFVSYCAALLFLTSKKIKFNYLYLNLIVILVLIQAILSATRSYTIAYLIILMGWILLQKMNQLPKFLFAAALIIVILLQFMSKSDIVKVQVDESYKRLITVKSLMRGEDPEAGKDSRLSGKTPRVLKKFTESPIIGFAFSDEFYENYDEHVGIPSLLLNLGAVGFIFFHIILLSMIFKIGKFRRTHAMPITNKLFYLSLIGILLIHILGRQLIGFIVQPYIHFFIVVYFSFWLFFTKNSNNDTYPLYR
jgi:hypothetical protein